MHQERTQHDAVVKPKILDRYTSLAFFIWTLALLFIFQVTKKRQLFIFMSYLLHLKVVSSKIVALSIVASVNVVVNSDLTE